MKPLRKYNRPLFVWKDGGERNAMNAKEREKIIQDVVYVHDQSSKAQSSIDAIFGRSCEAFQPMWAATSRAMSYASKLMGDTREESWLDWYIYECRCGRTPKECEVGGKKYRVKTPRDLAKVITADAKAQESL